MDGNINFGPPLPEGVRSVNFALAKDSRERSRVEERFRMNYPDSAGAPPDFFEHLDGPLRTLATELCQASMIPWETASVPIAIGFMSAIAGRGYQSPTELSTALYFVLTATSGGGKSSMNRALKKVARAAEVGYLLGPEHITADTSLHRSLLGNPRMLLNIDEFGAWFGRMTGRNSTGNQEALLRMLRNLRTLNGEDLMPAAYSQAARCLPAVRAPALSAIGYSTLQQFADAFRSELEEDGTLARMVEIPCGAPPRRRKDRPRAEFSAELVDVIRAVDDIAANGLPKERILEPKTEGKGDEVEPLPWPGELEPSAALHEVAYPDSLKEAIDQLCDVYDDDARDAEELGWIGAASAIRRAGEHVEKIAMVQAIARNPERPRIDEIDLRLGRQIADYSVKSMVARLRENAGETPYAKDRTRLEAFIEAAGAAGVALNELRRKSPVSGLPHGRRMELLSDLEEIGAIRSGQVPTGGRPQTRYWFAG